MSLFDFPHPVNEKAARSVAALVVLLAVATLLTRSTALLTLLTLGFAARVATGPTLSPFGQLATRVIAPRLGAPVLVAGPPKRFAQGIGLVVTATALVLALLSVPVWPWVLVGVLVAAASAEAVLGFCLGCKIFALLQRAGLIPREVCEACADLRLRTAATD